MYQTTKKRGATFVSERRNDQRIFVEKKGESYSQMPFINPSARPLAAKRLLEDNKRQRLDPEVNGDVKAREISEITYQYRPWDVAAERGNEDGLRRGNSTRKIKWGRGKWVGFAAKPRESCPIARGSSSKAGGDERHCSCSSGETRVISSDKEAEPQKSGQAQERTLVQLKIDAMFVTANSRQQQQSEGKASKSAPPGDVDVESVPSCYVCRGGLGGEGGDVLCSFCDRSVCQGCSQHCFACDIVHCSLCLAADFSSQFESYFCPPCYQDRRQEACHVGPTDTMVVIVD